jgi:hypothetical protein
VAIGTTAFEKDISYLRLDTTFADVLERGTRGARRDVRDAEPISPPADQWTATETIVRTSQA